ncbi:MAG: hypothetical protein ABIA37_00930 [Candidatus Woesearchaeota archaeon]
MVSFPELKARMRQYFGFTKQELVAFLIGIIITGFIFSFKDWGADTFNLTIGLKNLLFAILAAAISFFGHLAPQKMYALSTGYLVTFRAWYVGLIIALVLTFVSAGSLTLVLAGGAAITFMVRQRLGQFRYGYSMEEQAVVGMWGVLGSLITATVFRIFNFYFPSVLFFETGLMISLIFAACSVLPLPKMDGLLIFFGSRAIYFLSVVIVVASALLLLWGGGWGLTIGITVGLIAGAIAWLWGSEV